MTRQARALSGNGLAERRLTAEHVVARALVEASTFADAVPKILEAICRALDWEYGALWTVDREADILLCRHVGPSESVAFPDFHAMSSTSTFARGTGVPGRVWATCQPAWIRDVGL